MSSIHITSKYNLYVSNNNTGDVFVLVTITQDVSLSVDTIFVLVTHNISIVTVIITSELACLMDLYISPL